MIEVEWIHPDIKELSTRCSFFHFLVYNRYLPREVDPLVYNMSMEDPGDVNYSTIGGLSEQIRELREVSVLTH